MFTAPVTGGYNAESDDSSIKSDDSEFTVQCKLAKKDPSVLVVVIEVT